MKLDELRKIIREEVRSAVKDEIQDMLTEAVKVASAPTKMQPAPQPNTPWSAPKAKAPKITGDPIMEMLNQTKASMTQQDYQQVISMDSSMVNAPIFDKAGNPDTAFAGDIAQQPGIDLNQFDFISKAKAVLDASNKKDKERRGF